MVMEYQQIQLYYLIQKGPRSFFTHFKQKNPKIWTEILIQKSGETL